MALIICVECGKRFSDKALACPECGCPTSEMTGKKNEETVSEVVIKLDTSSEEASKKMYEAVSSAKRTASNADGDFDRANSRIQRMASSQIDLFGGNAVTRVADISQEAKKACDDLYAALQLALATLDNICRPLLIYKPEGKAIKEVYHEIKQLNSDSEISNTFSASVNYNSLGDVATRRYAPSIQAKMIEQFWKSEYEKVQAEMHKIESEKKAKEAAIQKKKEEEKRKQIEKFQNENKEIIDEYALKAKQSVNLLSKLEKETFDKRTEEITNKIKEEKADAQSSIDKDIDSKISNIKTSQSYLDSEYMSNVTVKRQNIDEKESTLAKLKIFEISKKKTLSSEIESLLNSIQALTANYKDQTSKYKKEIEDLQNKRSNLIKKQFDEIENRYSLPKMIEYKKEVVNKPVQAYAPTPTQMVNESMKDAIYDYLLTVDKANITDILTNCPEVADLTNQRVSAYVRQLMTDGRVERIEEKRMAFFSAVDGMSSKKEKTPDVKKNPVGIVESIVKEKQVSYKQLKASKQKDVTLLEEYEIYGALKYLAIDNKIYCEEVENDLNIFYIKEEYRKKN